MRLLYAAVLVALTVSPALAQREPEIVIPGRPSVPVYINGIDASWGIVEGEFGLDRPNEIAPTVVYRPFLDAAPAQIPGYYPADGRRPGYGRLEINPPPNRPLPPPAPSYYRYWSSQSAPGPVTQYPYPPVAISPIVGGYGPRRDSHHPQPNHQGGSRKDP
jgi:hypothetical protein